MTKLRELISLYPSRYESISRAISSLELRDSLFPTPFGRDTSFIFLILVSFHLLTAEHEREVYFLPQLSKCYMDIDPICLS